MLPRLFAQASPESPAQQKAETLNAKPLNKLKLHLQVGLVNSAMQNAAKERGAKVPKQEHSGL